MADIRDIASSLSEAQRRALMRLDGRVYSRSEIHHQTFGSLHRKGIAADVRAAGHRFFQITKLGEQVREYLNQEKV